MASLVDTYLGLAKMVTRGGAFPFLCPGLSTPPALGWAFGSTGGRGTPLWMWWAWGPHAPLGVSGQRGAVAALLLGHSGSPAAMAVPHPAVSWWVTKPGAQRLSASTVFLVGEAGGQLSSPHPVPRH